MLIITREAGEKLLIETSDGTIEITIAEAMLGDSEARDQCAVKCRHCARRAGDTVPAGNSLEIHIIPACTYHSRHIPNSEIL